MSVAKGTAIAMAVLTVLSANRVHGQIYNDDGWRLAVPDDPTWSWNPAKLFAPQREFKTEWWYYTGHLQTDEEAWFGFQVTFFRIGMKPGQQTAEPGETANTDSSSAWRFQSLWMGHFAMTDIEQGEYVAFHRLVRGAMDLGGADVQDGSIRLHIGDWEVWQRKEQRGDHLRIFHRLQLGERGWKLQLNLDPGWPVLQGEEGVSQKAEGRGRASYYWSYPRMKLEGTVSRPDGSSLSVTGSGWFDREIGSNPLGESQSGWDWFAIQLEDGTALMLYRMRLQDGEVDPYSHGKWIPALPEPGHASKQPDPNLHIHPTAKTLMAEEFQIEPTAQWTSSKTGVVYPVGWHIRVPDQGLDLQLRATLPDQEFVASGDVELDYWEGSHVVKGTRHGRTVKGRAYVELTGYGARVNP